MASGRLCPDREEGRRRLLVALTWMLQTGDAVTAATFTEELRALPPSPLRDSVLGTVAMARDDPDAAQEMYESAWKQLAAGSPDDEVSATIALQSAVHHFGRLDGEGTVDWCRRALELTGPGGAVGRTARTYLAHGLGYLGRVSDAFAAVEGVGGAEGDADDPEVGWLQPRSARGVLRLVDDDLDGARADLAAVGNRAYELGILNIAAFALGYLARAEYLAGAWDDAVGHAERAVAVNDEADWGFTWSTVVGIAVQVPAARGEWAAAEATLDGAAGRYPGGTSGRWWPSR